MTWFTLIMIVMVVSIIFGLLFTTRYLFSGRALFWARITMLLFDVIGMGGVPRARHSLSPHIGAEPHH